MPRDWKHTFKVDTGEANTQSSEDADTRETLAVEGNTSSRVVCVVRMLDRLRLGERVASL
jgi:hypothetical protein